MFRIFILIISFLYSSEDGIISKKYNDIFQARKQQADFNKKKDIYSVIKPITIYTSYGTNNQNDISSNILSAGINYNQDIYKSGNIWRGVDIAKINHKSNYFKIDIDKRNLIYTIYSLVLELNKINLDILKQKKLLENSKITKSIKEEKYLKGIVDISELDNALISVNNIENIINDLKLNKENKLSRFYNLSNKDYKMIDIPEIKVPSLDVFMQNNNIHNTKNTISMLDKKISVIKANYLPKVSINAQYGYADNNEREEKSNTSYSISIKASMNVNIFTRSVDVEQSKINTLVSRLKYEQSKKEEKTFYNQIIKQIEIYDNKIKLSNQSANKYDTLIKKIQDLYIHGIRTKEDVLVILNTKKIKQIESNIFKIKKQLSIIEIYKHFKNL
jgi:outer membrane protein TolC